MRETLSARITEEYERSDGEFYPAALQSVSAGSAIGLSNSGGGPGAYVDLSQSWIGEPGPSYGDDELSPRELAELDQVMAEVEAEYELPGGYGGQDYSGLAEFDATFSASRKIVSRSSIEGKTENSTGATT